jgi:RNA polymerase sigma-70 factor (ECF subfamily)
VTTEADETSEAQWIKAAAEGDVQAFTRLVERYRRLVLTIAWQMTGNLSDADDLAQECFLRAFRALPGFRGDASFKTWLVRIVTNLCHNWRRATPRTNAVCDEAFLARLPSPDVGPEHALLRSEQRRQVRMAVLALPEHERSVVVLRDWHGLRYQEIAVAMHIPIGTVMSRLAKARERLRVALRPYSTGVRA